MTQETAMQRPASCHIWLICCVVNKIAAGLSGGIIHYIKHVHRPAPVCVLGVKMDIRPALPANPLQRNVNTSSNQHGTAANISQQGTSVVLNPGDDKHQCAQPGQAAAAEHSNNPNTVSLIRWHLQHYRQQAMSNLKAVFAMSGEKSDEKDKQTPDT